MNKPYVIAEIANAAQGQYEKNFELIDSAKNAGADAVKIQLYKYDELCIPSYPKYDIYVNTFYTSEQRSEFIKYINKQGMDVWVDIFDKWGLQVAKDNIKYIKSIKIPSSVLLDQKLTKDICGLGVPIAIGVGGYYDEEIKKIIDQVYPSFLMYGFQAFPTKIENISLARIPYLFAKFNIPVGFADHVDATKPIANYMPVYAYLLGATVIEKHIILDRVSDKIDNSAALEPTEFRYMVESIKEAYISYGSESVSDEERKYLDHAVKLTSTKYIPKDAFVTSNDVSLRRVKNTRAIDPSYVNNYVPGFAISDIQKDTEVTPLNIRPVNIGIAAVCRLHSKRLEKKGLLSLGSVSIIERCLLNCSQSKVKTVVLTTSTDPQDDELCDSLKGVMPPYHIYRGSPNDVARRILDMSREYKLDFVIRVTGDSPFISYELIDYMIDSHLESRADYTFMEGAPLGTKGEMMTVSALQILVDTFDTSEYGEYLSLYFKNNPEIFKINKFIVPEEFRMDCRLNVDYPEDYELAKKIVEDLRIEYYSIPLLSVLSVLKKNPKWIDINKSIVPTYMSGELATKLNKVTKNRI